MDKKRIFRESAFLFLLTLLLIFSNIVIKARNSEERVIDKISSSLEKIQNEHDSIASHFKNNFQDVISDPEKFYPINPTNAIYIFQNDSLIYWNSDLNDPTIILKEIHSEKNIFTQGNNQFFLTLTQIDSLKLFTSTPLYYQSPNSSNKNIYLPEKINGSYSIDFLINDNQINFNIIHQAKMNHLDAYLLGILLIIIFIKSLLLLRHQMSAIKFLLSSCIIYFIIILLQNNLFISTSDLFGISCLNQDCKFAFSLGSLAEFTILLFTNAIIFSLNFKKELSLKNSTRTIVSCSIFIFILLIYTYLIYELISNINIPFSFLEIYNTTINSYIFLILIATITCSVIIILQSLMKIFISEQQSYIWSIVAFTLIGIVLEIILNKFIELRFSIITTIVGIVFYLSLVWEKKSKLKIRNIVRNIIVITLMTMQLTYILYLVKENKEYEEMSWFANVVGDESDKDFENAMLKTIEKLKNDNNIITWQKKNEFPSDDSILNYLNQKYFNTDEIKDYYKTVTLCDTSTILIIEDFDFEANCNTLFNNILENNHTEKISDELTLVDDPTTDSYYILKLDLYPIDSTHLNTCYIEFYKEYILNHIGIPEIITSSENVILPKLVNYSFSCYESNILQYKYGRYNYPNELDNFRYKDEEYVKTKIFKHLIKNINDNKTIIVTIEKPRFIDVIAPFSYIFIILILMYFLNLKLYKTPETTNYKRTLHAKMQLTIILTLGLSFIVAGITSFIFMRNSLNEKNFEFQYEKNKTIVKSLEKDIDKESITEYDYLKNYKENYFLDINIYDLNGNLINTTQPKLFNGFKSKIINRKAYDRIILKNRFYYSDEEKIDGVKYNSSYFPLKDKEGNTHFIINIPYFDNNINSKINTSNFIITYLNIILVLMGISALVVILMTRNTIKPLEIIQDKMKKISLTGKNEEIEWNSKDEIGDLIRIYNNLIKELEISANKLMRSERETAWREMARQVAHEIKNPLTPMKLNIQFLQMAWDEKNPDIDRKLRETTKTLLEQIDILSNIATAFSNYAKLPQKNIETFNIKELVINTINLYDNNPNINITLEEESESDYIIKSDKNNLSIVFGNIIKNAIQAIGKKEDGNILIKIKDVNNYYDIEISDNGCGIKDEEKKKIFMPNFTTKSSGMGVGLSIVYDILETLESTISFESEVGKGTIFRINIKK